MSSGLGEDLGEWFTVEYCIVEGNEKTGRFYMLMTRGNGKKQVIFDIQNYTHNTKDPNPDGITLWNPMKLYTSKNLVDYVRKEGKALQLYWDDFEIWKNRIPVINY